MASSETAKSLQRPQALNLVKHSTNMLSRRNIRIKIMQHLYSHSRDEQLSFDDVMARYRRSVSRAYALYLLNLWQIVRVANYARKDASIKQAKFRPSEEDLHFTSKLCDNPILSSISQNESFLKEIKYHKLEHRIDVDSARRLYMDFAKEEAYKKYLSQSESSDQDHIDVLLQLYKFMQQDEVFNDQMEDFDPSWIDDKSLVVGSIKKTLKALPAEDDFHQEYLPSDEAAIEFGEALLAKVFEFNRELFEIIEPTLKNWDAERVAVLDMILLKMALAELLYFPSIPTKVTLNEFVEISKLYSTDKSKDFVNGILDRLMKKLEKEGKINKEGRGLME